MVPADYLLISEPEDSSLPSVLMTHSLSLGWGYMLRQAYCTPHLLHLYSPYQFHIGLVFFSSDTFCLNLIGSSALPRHQRVVFEV